MNLKRGNLQGLTGEKKLHYNIFLAYKPKLGSKQSPDPVPDHWDSLRLTVCQNILQIEQEGTETTMTLFFIIFLN